MKKLIFVLLPFILVGCSTTKTYNVGIVNTIDSICILYNHRVTVTNFESSLVKLLGERGIDSKVVKRLGPECSYVITYVAFRRWSLVDVPMVQATLILWKDGNVLRTIEYGSRKNGMPWGDRFKGVEKQLRPLIFKLTQKY